MSARSDLAVGVARDWLGTPYHDQASVKGIGCDCLGLARGVWREVIGPEPLPIPPYSRDWGETGTREVLAEGVAQVMTAVPLAQAMPGDFLLFRMRPRAIAKHVGILVTHARFIHSYERLGVIEEPLSNAWRRRLAYVFRLPQEVR